MSKRRYDYVKACDQAMYGDKWRSNTRRVLRKLVREAVIAGLDQACIGFGCVGKESPNETAKRIARELIP